MAKNKVEKEKVDPDAIEVIVESDEDETSVLNEDENSAAQAVDSLEEALRMEIKQIDRELEETKESYLRAAAELQNLQKRNAQELEKARKFAIDSFAKSLLEVMESLDKACEADSATDVTAVLEGVELTRKQLMSVFEKAQIKKIEANPGDAFNVNEHEAMTLVPTDEYPANHVVEVFRPGYTIHDRLLRAAMVIVSAELPKAEELQESFDEPPTKDSENA